MQLFHLEYTYAELLGYCYSCEFVSVKWLRSCIISMEMGEKLNLLENMFLKYMTTQKSTEVKLCQDSFEKVNVINFIYDILKSYPSFVFIIKSIRSCPTYETGVNFLRNHIFHPSMSTGFCQRLDC